MLRCYATVPCPQDVPTLVSLPSPLPEGVPDEQQYIQAYCRARGLPYPLQASAGSACSSPGPLALRLWMLFVK